MKQTALFPLCILLLSLVSNAQSFQQKPDLFFLYANIGGGVPGGTGFIGGDLITKQGWSVSVSFANSFRDSPIRRPINTTISPCLVIHRRMPFQRPRLFQPAVCPAHGHNAQRVPRRCNRDKDRIVRFYGRIVQSSKEKR